MAIVAFLEHTLEIGAHFGEVLIAASVPLFVLEFADEALAESFVVRVTGTAHADPGAVLFEQGDVVAAGVLRAAVGVMNPAGLRPHGEHHRQLAELAARPQTGDVGDPLAVRPRSLRPTHQVRTHAPR